MDNNRTEGEVPGIHVLVVNELGEGESEVEHIDPGHEAGAVS